MTLLPYLEQSGLRYYDYGILGRRSYMHPANRAGSTGCRIPSLLCPADAPRPDDGWPGGPGTTGNASYHNYVVNFGNTGIVHPQWQASTFRGNVFGGAPFTWGGRSPSPRSLTGRATRC